MDKKTTTPELKEIITSLKQLITEHEAYGVSDYFSQQSVNLVEDVTSDNAAMLEDVAQGVRTCQNCDLCKTRTNAVPGQGDANARLVFVGEAPGRDEDLQGMAFVGRAGQLLTKIIEAIDMKRDDVFICNIIKCRPPQNRNPEPDEIVACFDYLDRQLDILRPDVICTLGKFASQTLLETETPISKLRGHFHDFRGIPLMPTYHPAYLLRNPRDKRLVWEDVQKIRDLL